MWGRVGGPWAGRDIPRGLPTQEMESPEQKPLIQGHPLPMAALTVTRVESTPSVPIVPPPVPWPALGTLLARL